MVNPSYITTSLKDVALFPRIDIEKIEGSEKKEPKPEAPLPEIKPETMDASLR